MDRNLHEMVPQINTREQMVDFLYALSKDLSEHGDEWENPTLERYLEAMASWISSMHGFYKNTGRKMPEVNWRVFADILYAATIYE